MRASSAARRWPRTAAARCPRRSAATNTRSPTACGSPAGGFQGGLTYGKTDEIGWSPIENPVHINDLHATILHQFGFDHRRLAVDYKGLSVRLTDQGGKVVHDLLA